VGEVTEGDEVAEGMKGRSEDTEKKLFYHRDTEGTEILRNPKCENSEPLSNPFLNSGFSVSLR
jgi:hypothetical protein